jgi:hypothetical protein
MDASVQVTSTRHLGTSMPSRGRPPHHYPYGVSAESDRRDPLGQGLYIYGPVQGAAA